MNAKESMTTPSEHVQRQADAWFACRRDGPCQPEDEARFQQWMARDESHVRAYAKCEREWDALSVLRESAMFRRVADDALKAGPRQRGRVGFAPWKPLLLAACLATVAVMGALRLASPPEVPVVTYATTLGEQRTEALADGSRITLNTDTLLEVRLGRLRRDVMLRQGEALFEVSGDAARPFVVTAGGGSTTALGTRFMVREHDGSVRVTLLEGVVAVSTDGRDGQVAVPAGAMVQPRRHLVPGQQAIYTGAGQGIDVRRADAEMLASWTEGRIDIDAMPLAEALSEINRYSSVKLRLEDPSLEALVVSGVFHAGENTDIAMALSAIYPLRIARVTETEILLARSRR